MINEALVGVSLHCALAVDQNGRCVLAALFTDLLQETIQG